MGAKIQMRSEKESSPELNIDIDIDGDSFDNSENSVIKKCKKCDKVFKKRSLLRKHKRIVHPKKAFKCHQCTKTYRFKSDRNQHEVVAHGSNKKLECKKCSRWFLYQKDLNVHNSSVHKIFQLQIEHNISEHEKSVNHSVSKKDSVVDTTESENDDMGSSRGDKKFPCPQCSQRFKMERHRNLHIKLLHNTEEDTSDSSHDVDIKFNIKRDIGDNDYAPTRGRTKQIKAENKPKLEPIADDMYSNLKRKTVKTIVKKEIKTESKVLSSNVESTNTNKNDELQRKLEQMRKENARMEAKLKTQERALESKNLNIENLKMDLVATKKELGSRGDEVSSNENKELIDFKLPEGIGKLGSTKKLRLNDSIGITSMYSVLNPETEHSESNTSDTVFFNSNSTDEEKIIGYEKEKEEFREKIRNLQNEVTGLKRANVILQNEANSKNVQEKDELIEIERALQNEKKEKDGLKETIKNLNAENSQLKRKNKSYGIDAKIKDEKLYEELQEKMKMLQNENASLKKSNKMLDIEMKTKETRIGCLMKNMENMQAKMKKAIEDEENRRMKENKMMEELEAKSSSQLIEMESMKQIIENSKANCHTNCKSKIESEQYMNKLLTLQSKVKNIQSTRAAELDSLHVEMKKTDALNKTLSTSNEQIMKELKESKDACLTKCSVDINAQKFEILSLKNTNANLESIVKDFKENHQNTCNEIIAKLKAEREELKKEKEGLKKNVGELDDDHRTNCKSAVSRLEKEKSDLKQELEEMTTNYQNAAEQIDDMAKDAETSMETREELHHVKALLKEKEIELQSLQKKLKSVQNVAGTSTGNDDNGKPIIRNPDQPKIKIEPDKMNYTVKDLTPNIDSLYIDFRNVPNMNNVQCTLCGSTTQDITEMRQHINFHFPENKRCPNCEWLCPDKVLYNQHVEKCIKRGRNEDTRRNDKANSNADPSNRKLPLILKNSTRQSGEVSYQEFMNSTHKPLDIKLKTLNENNGNINGTISNDNNVHQNKKNVFKRDQKDRIELPMKSYEEHYFQNPDTNNFECKLCSRIFDSKTDCQEHIAGQHFPEYVACPFCQKKYCHGQSLRQHVTQTHKQLIKHSTT